MSLHLRHELQLYKILVLHLTRLDGLVSVVFLPCLEVRRSSSLRNTGTCVPFNMASYPRTQKAPRYTFSADCAVLKGIQLCTF